MRFVVRRNGRACTKSTFKPMKRWRRPRAGDTIDCNGHHLTFTYTVLTAGIALEDTSSKPGIVDVKKGCSLRVRSMNAVSLGGSRLLVI
jgi:hypothetical protein